MKKLSLFALVCALCLSAVAAFAENPAVPNFGGPALITALGQSQDANFVNLLAKRKKLATVYDLHVFNKDVDWSKYKSLVYVLGGSGKGLGAAGLVLTFVPTLRESCVRLCYAPCALALLAALFCPSEEPVPDDPLPPHDISAI